MAQYQNQEFWFLFDIMLLKHNSVVSNRKVKYPWYNLGFNTRFEKLNTWI